MSEKVGYETADQHPVKPGLEGLSQRGGLHADGGHLPYTHGAAPSHGTQGQASLLGVGASVPGGLSSLCWPCAPSSQCRGKWTFVCFSFPNQLILFKSFPWPLTCLPIQEGPLVCSLGWGELSPGHPFKKSDSCLDDRTNVLLVSLGFFILLFWSECPWQFTLVPEKFLLFKTLKWTFERDKKHRNLNVADECDLNLKLLIFFPSILSDRWAVS